MKAIEITGPWTDDIGEMSCGTCEREYRIGKPPEWMKDQSVVLEERNFPDDEFKYEHCSECGGPTEEQILSRLERHYMDWLAKWKDCKWYRGANIQPRGGGEWFVKAWDIIADLGFECVETGRLTALEKCIEAIGEE